MIEGLFEVIKYMVGLLFFTLDLTIKVLLIYVLSQVALLIHQKTVTERK